MDRKLLKEFKNSGLKGNALKDVIQNYSIDCWVETGCTNYLECYTGWGKTITVFKAIQRYNKVYNDGYFVILVPTIKLQKQWLKKLAKVDITNVDVYVLKGYCEGLCLSPNYNYTCTALIVDELHTICNDQSKFFSQAIALTQKELFLGVSATLEDKHKKFLSKYNIFECFNITIEEGLELGLVPHYSIYNLGCPLTEKEENLYDFYNGQYNKNLAYFSAISYYDSYSLMMACISNEGKRKAIQVEGKTLFKTPSQWIQHVADYYEKTPKEITIIANICRESLAKRNNVLHTTESKLKTTIELINLFRERNTKLVVYTSTNVRANKIAEQANIQALHAKIKNSDIILEQFENNEITELVTNKMLDAGIDDELLEVGINEHYTSTALLFTQRIGRLIRYLEDRVKHPIFISLYSISANTANTIKQFQDKIQLAKAQKGRTGVKWIKNLNEIKL